MKKARAGMNNSDLRRILANMRASIPEELEKDLLEQHGGYVTDDEGHQFPYTEQDIHELLRKKLRQYEKGRKANLITF
jgi:hypothetical protein